MSSPRDLVSYEYLNAAVKFIEKNLYNSQSMYIISHNPSTHAGQVALAFLAKLHPDYSLKKLATKKLGSVKYGMEKTLPKLSNIISYADALPQKREIMILKNLPKWKMYNGTMYIN